MFYRQYMMADPKRMNVEGGLVAELTKPRTQDDDDAHIAWMMEQLEQHCWDWTELAGQDGVWTNDKKMRWLGFIQGYLWANQMRTISEMREDNRNDKITNLVSGESIKPGRWQRRPPSNSSNSGS
jgi:hypothetical protein